MPHPSVMRMSAPRIYCIAASALARVEDEQGLLRHVAGLGFDALLLSDCDEMLLPAARADGNEPMNRLATSCRNAGLHLLLDIELDRFPHTHPLHTAHPSQFYPPAHHTEDLPDPRLYKAPVHHRHMHDHVHLRLDHAGLDLAQRYWSEQLALWLQAGVNGFRCLSLSRIPPWLWQALIDGARAVRNDALFLAWTPGIPAEQLTELRACGFDAVFGSDAWWDYRADWLIEERQRLASIAPVIATPEDPTGPRLRHRLHLDSTSEVQRAYRRAL